MKARSLAVVSVGMAVGAASPAPPKPNSGRFPAPGLGRMAGSACPGGFDAAVRGRFRRHCTVSRGRFERSRPGHEGAPQPGHRHGGGSGGSLTLRCLGLGWMLGAILQLAPAGLR
jgi:hypothetical protein